MRRAPTPSRPPPARRARRARRQGWNRARATPCAEAVAGAARHPVRARLQRYTEGPGRRRTRMRSIWFWFSSVRLTPRARCRPSAPGSGRADGELDVFGQRLVREFVGDLDLQAVIAFREARQRDR